MAEIEVVLVLTNLYSVNYHTHTGRSRSNNNQVSPERKSYVLAARANLLRIYIIYSIYVYVYSSKY